MNLHKKGQFKIQQMAFMLLAVFLFFILVSLFWMAIQSRNLHKRAVELEQSKVLLMVQFLSSTSEFSCSREMGPYCIDSDKLIVLKNKSVYKNFWPVSFIRIRKVYPRMEKDVVCNEANYPNCNIFDIYSGGGEGGGGGSGEGSFVALCRYEKVEGYSTRICDLGKMIIGYKRG